MLHVNYLGNNHTKVLNSYQKHLGSEEPRQAHGIYVLCVVWTIVDTVNVRHCYWFSVVVLWDCPHFIKKRLMGKIVKSFERMLYVTRRSCGTQNKSTFSWWTEINWGSLGNRFSIYSLLILLCFRCEILLPSFNQRLIMFIVIFCLYSMRKGLNLHRWHL